MMKFSDKSPFHTLLIHGLRKWKITHMGPKPKCENDDGIGECYGRWQDWMVSMVRFWSDLVMAVPEGRPVRPPGSPEAKPTRLPRLQTGYAAKASFSVWDSFIPPKSSMAWRAGGGQASTHIEIHVTLSAALLGSR